MIEVSLTYFVRTYSRIIPFNRMCGQNTLRLLAISLFWGIKINTYG